MINSRNLEHLDKRLIEPAKQLILKCRQAGVPILITQTLRDVEYQNFLYAKGRTAPGVKCTNARGGSSYHNYGLAIDFAPLTNGKPNYSNSALFKKVATIAKSLGFEWAGDIPSIKWDLGHLQMTFGLTIAELKAGKR
jgi:peptidoglycan L-alanyl-D-glutamate endopeptidase CwlK